MNKTPMIENACKDLLQYGIFDMRAKCKYLVKRFLLRQTVAGEDVIFWPTGLLAAGLCRCRKELETKDTAVGNEVLLKEESVAKTIESTLTAYYLRWFKKGMPIVVLDDLLAGETLLNIYLEMQKGRAELFGGLPAEKCRTALDAMAAFALGHKRDGAGSLIYRPAHAKTTIFVDGIGLACPFLYQYGEAFEKHEYREMALLQIVNFLSYGMDSATGLPYHGYDGTDGCKYGIIGWGRAVGWLLRGMMGCMISEYGSKRLCEPYIDLMDAVLAYQRQDGYFSWQLEALEGPADTSATGMICFALRQGIESGILAGEGYEKALLAGRRAIEKSVRNDRVYNCSGECEGFSCYPQRYGAYPWSLGPALAVLQREVS